MHEAESPQPLERVVRAHTRWGAKICFEEVRCELLRLCECHNSQMAHRSEKVMEGHGEGRCAGDHAPASVTQPNGASMYP